MDAFNDKFEGSLVAIAMGEDLDRVGRGISGIKQGKNGGYSMIGRSGMISSKEADKILSNIGFLSWMGTYIQKKVSPEMKTTVFRTAVLIIDFLLNLVFYKIVSYLHGRDMDFQALLVSIFWISLSLGLSLVLNCEKGRIQLMGLGNNIVFKYVLWGVLLAGVLFHRIFIEL